MFEKQEFIKPVFSLKELPSDNLPQVILCGRSNVGKSSFINSFFNRKNLAKTSSTPGKTRSINFYLVDDKFYIVDLPGYGYAKTSKKERIQWGELVGDFISNSKNIIFAFHILDSRHKPTELDAQLNSFLLHEKIPFAFILNKADKLKQSEFNLSIKNLEGSFGKNKLSKSIFYSSIKNLGRKEVHAKLTELFYSN